MYLDLMRSAGQLAGEAAAVDRRAGFGLLNRLEECERKLRQAYEKGVACAAAGKLLSPAAAWLLDHGSFVISEIREVREAVPRGYYRDLPRMREGPYRGHPRVYRLAAEVVAASGERLDLDRLAGFFQAYQEFTPLTLAEIWAIGPMIKLVLIERACDALEEHEGHGLREAIGNLRRLERVSWRDFVESICVLEPVLRQDPVYGGMDFETRDGYRHAIEAIGKRSPCSELEVARLAVELAQASAGDEREGHVGFYLVGPGVKLLRRQAGYRAPWGLSWRDLAYRYPNALYLGGVVVLTVLIAAAALVLLPAAPWWIAALLVLPASQAAVVAVNLLTTALVPPRRLPRLDFSRGIPDDCRSFVVVPTLLLSRGGVERLLERLEIHYLANRDPNLLFALLTDFPDASTPTTRNDALLEDCIEGIRLLNRRYGSNGSGPFYLFHRPRVWNEREGVWMGHERKRGKLSDFNRFLLGQGDAFSVKVGDLPAVGSIRYVITLDSDTQIPRDTARKLIATAAHPLNQPVIDPVERIIRDGYTILQPRISISMESAARSRLARIYSGQTGFDPYTTAVSDLYQDLYGQGSFTGKGLYDLRAFQAVLEDRFPDNALLSHDLIEGEHVRTGLVTDLELIDDYPSTYQAYSKRKHRWTRGDWQILFWLRGKAPNGRGEWERNPLSLISRWKIADNLRRSLHEMGLLAMLLAGFVWLGRPFVWVLAGLALLALPAWLELATALLRLPPRRFLGAYLREIGFRFAHAHLDAVLQLALAPHQALVMADAIGRTLARLFITRKRLLEWETMAQAEESAGKGRGLMDFYLWLAPVLGLGAVLALRAGHAWDALALILIEAWIGSPLLVAWLNAAPRAARGLERSEVAFLRDVALRTWRFFSERCGPEDNWLVPDNVQEDPPATAHRVSPTNLGLLLAAHVTAMDLGYLTRSEAAERLGLILDTTGRLDRYRGHFYNWYDTRTLAVLPPCYVSTVDSGNLAASLVVLKQAYAELLKRPVLDGGLLAGIGDHCARLRNSLPPAVRSSRMMQLLASLERQMQYHPTDLFYWESVLTEAGRIAGALRERVEWACWQVSAAQGAEIRYWYDALTGRIEAALRELYGVAPWVAEPFEMELRMRSGDTAFQPLLERLYPVPSLGELPERYGAIAGGIRELLEGGGLDPLARRTLERLLRALPEARRQALALRSRVEEQAEAVARLIEEMDFVPLFDGKQKLLHVGCDAGSGELDAGYYDLLASEARTAVFLAIAKGDIPREAWFHLGRKLVFSQGERTLLSWSGTMFEYLMPCLFMRTRPGTLLAESLRGAVRIQQAYGREHGLPWGISEAAYGARDSALNYQYQAFGAPMLGLNRVWPDRIVVAPYASALALMVEPSAAARNLEEMQAEGWTGRYGFYESVEFRQDGSARAADGAVVRAFMAHHQGMTLLAIGETLLENPMQRRFHADPMVQATEYLLEERLPALLGAGAEAEQLPEAPAVAATGHNLAGAAAESGERG
ncbi:MAG: hypothetical protein IT158_23260 [Bryobacterales bacterium]|nr:hypothetical protein [Bryobacterales bacterium]